MDGVGDNTLTNAALPQSAPSRSIDGIRQQSNQLSPSRNPSKVSKSSLSIHRAQEGENKLAAGLKNKLATTRRVSPTARRIERKQDGPPQERKLLRKPTWTTKETRTEIAPDGNSAGRDGRKFTVANVGLNGKMYLRPAIRPANQRYAQPQFSFPITPPSSAGLDALVARNTEEDTKSQVGDSLWTPTRSPSTPTRRSTRGEYFQKKKSATLPRAAHKRAHSYSTTADEQYSTLHDGNEGTFKIVIERPGSSRGRPRTATQLSGETPTLAVPIPSYKLGTPRFSRRGTAFIRGSSYHGSHDERSSILTMKNALHPMFPGSDNRVSRRHSHDSPSPNTLDRLSPAVELPRASPAITHMSMSISPGMYNNLTFKPECDDPSLVRYAGDSITAAVPPRLISEITSPCFLDYDLLSDFFLTFRSYLTTSDLLLMLISRLDWALERDDEVGMIVRVRTFVAIRHWILNYFMDDFVIDYNLRAFFCDLINNLVAAIKQGQNRKGNQLKIVEELKKCWRRTCALYWDSPDFGNDVPAEVPLRPGGVYGHRNADLTPAHFSTVDGGPPQLDDFLVDQETSSTNDFFADVQRAANLDWAPEQARKSLPEASKEAGRDAPMSPESRMSIDAVSCSFPTKAKKAAVGSHPRPVVHPFTNTPEYNQQPSIATTPKALTGKRVRPANAHKRNGSFSDSMRDERARQPVQTAVYKSTEFLMTLPFGGSLVRGNLFPPGKALVEVVSPTTPSDINRTTLNYPHTPQSHKGPSAMSGPGMRKLIGSVRRALGTRNGMSPGASPTVGSFPKLALLGVKGATMNRLPGTAVVPQGRLRHSSNDAEGCALRIDLLGAGIADDFKRAVQEDQDGDSNPRSRASNANTITSKEIETQATQNVPTVTPARPSHNRATPSELTAGSKSILIVDDTVPFPDMSGALPIVSGSVDTFSDAYLQPSAGPTPPLTPPEQLQTTPRRSSEILGERRNQFRSLSLDRTPSLVQDVRSPSETEQSPAIERSVGRPSVLSYGRSFKSKRSLSLRRYASFQSGFTRQTRQRSFDATTYTESRDDAFSQGIPSLPPPPHTLRRRPGGDLRAVANVGDLEPAPLRRHRSLGSISTYDESIRSSYMLGRDSADLVSMMSTEMPHPNAQTFSLGALAESSSPAKGQPSLCSTTSSKPVMRPSFEKEAAKLAQIPDDDFDNGGVESALLKLEGKYEQRRSEASEENAGLDIPASPRSLATRSVDEESVLVENEFEDDEKRRHRLRHVDEEIGITNTPPLLQTYRPETSPNQPTEVLKPAVYQPRGLDDHPQSFYNQESDPSYSSIPLLERGVTDDEHSRRNKHDWSHTSILREPSDERHPDDDAKADSSHPSYDFVHETDSMKRIVGDDGANAGAEDPSSPKSFLTSDSEEDRSDLSSEMSLEVISNEQGADNVTSLTAPHQPTPNIKPEQRSPDMLRSPLIHENQLQQPFENNPITPTITPTTSTERHDPTNHHPGEPFQGPPYATRQTSLHLPFILAFPSSILAQQFTLIEKDALHEIDWKELIDMRWKSLPTPALSWVSFLRTASPRGVEVVIARFNIMVKWAVSEVVLTANIEERARCISKFIHIAAHCRRHKNFATLYQLTVAMTSNELSRLANTWALVSEEDRKTLRELETLVQPTKNFYALRVEMERLGIEDACIPFIGVYTQDLLWNAQRPSIIDEDKTSSNGAGPLINFEKCRVQAGIIKSLLRLLEASSLYTWGPVEGVTERCLWMARLSDEEIRRRVDALE